jgi:hypothetical protein
LFDGSEGRWGGMLEGEGNEGRGGGGEVAQTMYIRTNKYKNNLKIKSIGKK